MSKLSIFDGSLHGLKPFLVEELICLKSSTLPVGEVENAYVIAITGILGCQLNALPSSYLWLPLGAKYKEEKPILETVVEKYGKTKNFLVGKPSASLKGEE